MRGSSCLLLVFAASCTCGREISGSACDSSNPCVQSTFSQAAGKCVDSAVADGTSCDAGLDCLVNTRCAAGTCVGVARSCDDQNACTQDSCVEGEGCQHTAIQCQPDNPCQVYACNPSSGCYDTESTLADGTTCQLWWEPCVDDATCSGGVCDSPTADEEVPGQVRWQVSLGGPFGAMGPITVDDAGTSTFLAVPDSGKADYELVAIDACGRVLWTTHTGFSIGGEVMQDDRQFVALAVDGAEQEVLISLDPATGEMRWSVDLLAQAGLDAGLCIDTFSPVTAESTTGSIEALVDACGVMVVLSWNSEGELQWMRKAALVQPSFWQAQWIVGAFALDANGDAFAVDLTAYRCEGEVPPAAVLWGVSSSGESILQVSLPNESPPGECVTPSTMSPIVGADAIIVTSEQGPGFVVAFDGGISATLPPLSFGEGRVFFSSPVQDADGNVFIPGVLTDAGTSGVTAFSQTGTVLWTSPAITGASLLLSDDGLLFGSQLGDGGLSAGMVALDTATGAPRLSLAVPDPIMSIPRVALTPGGSLLTVNQQGAIAIFAGKHRPSTTAPWSRWGGDNSNRSSAR